MLNRTFLLVTALLVFLVSQTRGRSRRSAAELPIQLVGGFAIVVRGDIATAHNLNLLVDTGAVPSVLSAHVARKLISEGTWASLVANGRQSDVPYVTVHAVRVGSVAKPELPMVVVDLRALEVSLHARIDGIRGLDFFVPQSFSIDYRRRKLVLGLSERARHALRSEVRHEFGAPYWIVPLTVNGNVVRVLLDTGANSITLFTSQVRNLQQDSFHGPTAFTLTGQLMLETARPLTLAFGDAQFRQPSVYMRPTSERGLQGLQGVFGPTSLGLTVIAFDWKQQTLRWDMD